MRLLIETTKRTAVKTSTSRRRRRRRRRVVRVVIRGGRCDPKRRRSVRVMLVIVLIESTELIPLRVVVIRIVITRIVITSIVIRSASPHDDGFSRCPSLSLYLLCFMVTRLKSLSSLLMRAFFARVKVPRKRLFKTIPTGKSLHLKASSSSSSKA